MTSGGGVRVPGRVQQLPIVDTAFPGRPGRYEVFNLGNGRGFSNREVIDAVREVTGADFQVRVEARRPGDPATCIASSAKTNAELGWKPQRPDLADIISDAWQFHQAIL